MTLLALIRKRDTGSIATAIPAISAIPDKQSTGNERRIARIAGIAVANPTETKPATVGADDTAQTFDQDWLDERFAILEHDAGFTRDAAEYRAHFEVTTWKH